MPRDKDWFLFGCGYYPVFEAGRTSRPVAKAIVASTLTVKIGYQYAQKLRGKHRIPPEEFKYIEQAIKYGEPLFQSPSRAVIHFYAEALGAHFEVVLKSTRAGDEIWVMTFHRQSRAEIKRKRKRLRPIDGKQ